MSTPETPDRHTPLRSPGRHATCALRTSLSPEILTTRERYSRDRDASRNPFRARSESRPRTTQQITANGNGMLAPHYVPSFVHRDGSDMRESSPRLGNVRYISLGGAWSVGGRVAAVPTQIQGIDNGIGELLASGTNAPLVTANFVDPETDSVDFRAHESRLAMALDIDQARRRERRSSFNWRTDIWDQKNISPTRAPKKKLCTTKPEKAVPSIAFRVLDAPRLKDDFYCSILAYCYTCRTLAVALTHRVYLWTEQHGVRYPPLAPARAANFVSALAFSSPSGSRAILAIARNSGHVTLWSLFEQKSRFEAPHPWAACAVAWRPTTTQRRVMETSQPVECEDLLIGDDSGCLYYYSVHWPEFAAGSMTLLMKLDAHSQNICGLAWSPNGKTFTSGGNDNSALIFEVDYVLKDTVSTESQDRNDDAGKVSRKCSQTTPKVLTPPQSPSSSIQRPEAPYTIGHHDNAEQVGMQASMAVTLETLTPPDSPGRTDGRGRPVTRTQEVPTETPIPEFMPFAFPPSQQNLENSLANPGIDGRVMMHSKSFPHAAAVKAIAYAPWQPTLLATGGGSNDRQIHFHHTVSGSTLAVINVDAQVTSLSWSWTRREIVATFGYAQPEHDVRIAVFAWPSCECVVSIPWERKANGEIGRALWAIPYPGGPNDAAVELEDEETTIGFEAWEAVRAREVSQEPMLTRNPRRLASPENRTSQWAQRGGTAAISRKEKNKATRGEGETWASRTEEEGSLIIACCDQTVKFFEIWAGKSKGRSKGIGAKKGILGGSKVLEGWCQDVTVDEVNETDSIR